MNIWDDLHNLILNIVATMIAIFLIYEVFKPRLTLDPKIRVGLDPVTGQQKYNCAYRNTGIIPVHDVRVKLLIRFRMRVNLRRQAYHVQVPVDDMEVPQLLPRHKWMPQRIKGRNQLPKMLLDQVEWSQTRISPVPEDPVDLQAFLGSQNAELYLHVTGTSRVGQITKVFTQIYRRSDFEIIN